MVYDFWGVPEPEIPETVGTFGRSAITLEMMTGDPYQDWPLIVTRFEWLRDVAPPAYLKKRLVGSLEPVTPVTPVTIQCVQCDALFEPARNGPAGKYCSSACKQASYRERNSRKKAA